MKSMLEASVALALVSALTSGCGGVAEEEADSGTSSVQSAVLSTGTFRYDGLYGVRTQCPVEITEGGVRYILPIHCCREGEAMIGADVDANIFKCSPLSTFYGFAGSPTIDRGTQRFGMHACPFGKIMVGYRHDWD